MYYKNAIFPKINTIQNTTVVKSEFGIRIYCQTRPLILYQRALTKNIKSNSKLKFNNC